MAKIGGAITTIITTQTKEKLMKGAKTDRAITPIINRHKLHDVHPPKPGLKYRESPSRKFTPPGSTKPRPLRCFVFDTFVKGKHVKSTIGWEDKVAWDNVLNRYTELMTGGETSAARKRTVQASRTINEYWDEVFKPECESDPKQQNFLQHKLGRWERYYRDDPIGSVKLIELTKEDIRAFWNRLPMDFAQATKVQIFGILSQMVAYASDEDDFPGKNPFPAIWKKIDRVGDANAREAWFSPSQAIELLQAILNPPNGRCELRTGDKRELFESVLIALWTGLRANELLRLQVQHYRADTGSIILLRRGRSKTMSTVSIPVPKPIAITLRKRISGKAQDDLLFPSFWGVKNPDDKKAIKNAVTALGQRFGYVLDRLGWNIGKTDRAMIFSWHSTRHTAITWKMILENGNVPIVKEFARHRKVEMTMRYTHYLEGDLASTRKGLATFWEELAQIASPKPSKIVAIR